MTNPTNVFINARQLGKSMMNASWLHDIYEEYFGDAHKSFVQQYRKGWESPKEYSLKNERKAPQTPVTIPDVSTLPAKRWVKPRALEGTHEEILELCREREQWMVDNKIKFHESEVLINGKPDWVCVFKKPTQALLFKLTWG